MMVLGLESSCDETAAAVLDGPDRLKSSIIASQEDVHRKFGGVVPEVAARKHSEIINVVIEGALSEAGVSFDDLNLVAVTAGPGLAVSLVVGISAARALSYSLGIPAVGVNHLEGHLLSNMFRENKPEMPAICLLVSGGHTEIVRVEGIGEYEVVGYTVDDAAGEAFDKVSRLLELGYPGGPIIQKTAESGDSGKVRFPRPMIGDGTFNFSFSGLKTAVVNFMKTAGKKIGTEISINDIAASFQEAAVDVLVTKTLRAAADSGVKSVWLAGGVSANAVLRNRMKEESERKGFSFFCPSLEYCTDNAAMIAMAGYWIAQDSRNSLPLSPAPGCSL